MIDITQTEKLLTIQQLPGIIESLLFAAGDPVSLSALCEYTGHDKATVSKVLDKMIRDYDQNPWGGLRIAQAEDKYTLSTKPHCHPYLERMYAPKGRPPMSQAAYETLAVIAYNQPVTRAQVEAVRGVSSDSIISRLLERGWIMECGHLDAPGRPTIFKTTEQFLLEFGIKSVSELPSLELMMYSTIRDLEASLAQATGAKEDVRQVSMEQVSAEHDRLSSKEEQNDREDES